MGGVRGRQETQPQLKCLRADGRRERGVAEDADTFGAAKWDLQLKHQGSATLV